MCYINFVRACIEKHKNITSHFWNTEQHCQIRQQRKGKHSEKENTMKKKTQWKHTLILKKLFCCFSLDARFKIVESGLADFHLFAIIAFHSITFVPCSICAHFRLHTKEEQWKTILQDSPGHSQSDSPADFWLGEDEEGWKDRKGESEQIIEEGNPDIYPLVKDSLLTDM